MRLAGKIASLLIWSSGLQGFLSSPAGAELLRRM